MKRLFRRRRRDTRIAGVYAGPEQMAKLLRKNREKKESEIEDVYAGPEPPDDIREQGSPMLFVYAGPGQMNNLRDESELEAVYAGPEQMNGGFLQMMADKLKPEKPYPENYADEDPGEETEAGPGQQNKILRDPPLKRRYKFCPICKRPNDPDAKFCKECGSVFKADSNETRL